MMASRVQFKDIENYIREQGGNPERVMTGELEGLYYCTNPNQEVSDALKNTIKAKIDLQRNTDIGK